MDYVPGSDGHEVVNYSGLGVIAHECSSEQCNYAVGRRRVEFLWNAIVVTEGVEGG